MRLHNFPIETFLYQPRLADLKPEYRVGVEARCNALLESMMPFIPLPPELSRGNVYRTPIYLQEVAHRKATQTRDITGT